MQAINMIMIHYCDKKLIKKLLVQEADNITIDVSSRKDEFFTGSVPNDRYYTYLSNKSYYWVASILRHPVFITRYEP